MTRSVEQDVELCGESAEEQVQAQVDGTHIAFVRVLRGVSLPVWRRIARDVLFAVEDDL